jgi:TPR repeat protein
LKLNVSRFKPWAVLLFCGITFAVSTVWAQTEEDIEWLATLTAASSNGDAAAQDELGTTYYRGQRVPRDYSAAAMWLTRAAEQGYASAQSKLGELYRNGEGVPKNYATAVTWYTKAAEQGEATAQIKLGAMNILGDGVPSDNVIGYMWLDIGSAHGPEQVAGKAMKGRLAEVMTAADISKAQELSRECLAQNYKNCGY